MAACALFLSAVFPTDGGRGLIGTLAAFGSVAAFALAPDDVGGMKNAILFYSIALMVCGVLVMIFLADNKPVKAEIKAETPLNMKDFLQVARIPRVWLCGILYVCNHSALIFHGYITGYLSEAFDISSTVVANFSVIRTYFMMIVGSLAAGILADKLGSRIKFMQYAYVGMAVFASLYVLIPTGAKAVPLIVANFLVFGLCLYSIKAHTIHASEGGVRAKWINGRKVFRNGERFEEIRKDYTSSNEYTRLAGVDLLKNRVDLCSHIGAGAMVLHMQLPWRWFAQDPAHKEEYFRQVYKSFDKLEPYARAAGVKVALENLIVTPWQLRDEQFERLFDRYDPEFLGFTYDSGHATLQCCHDYYYILRKYHSRLYAAHLQENHSIDPEMNNDDVEVLAHKEKG